MSPPSLAQPTKLDCSLRNLLTISAPMIFGSFSSTFMLLLDRLMLSHYSTHVMDAVFAASQVMEMVLLPLVAFASFSEILVGQFNGARLWHKASIPTIQIGAFLLLCWTVVCPCVLLTSHYLIPEGLHEAGYSYLKIGLFTIPFQILFVCTAAFFVGTRQPSLVLYTLLLANGLNLLLDYLLIFGCGPIPEMGATGAALASFIAIATAACSLLYFFLCPATTKRFATRRLVFNWPILRKNLAVGLPFALSELLETMVWLYVLKALARVSLHQVTVQAVCSTAWFFLLFLVEGIQKGSMALVANCIGAQKEHLVKRLIGSTLRLTAIVSVAAFLVLITYGENVLHYGFHITDPKVMADLKSCFLVLWALLNVGLITFGCLHGILSAGGDTLFATLVRTFTIITFVVLPVAITFHNGTLTAATSWYWALIQQSVNGLFFYMRFRGPNWRRNFTQTL